jgi:thiol:disulfide interchange protein DsbC
VSRTPVAHLYEAWMGPNVAYVSSHDLRYLIFGRLWDSRSMQDLTAARMGRGDTATSSQDEPRIDIDQLPLADAIRSVRGTGRRHLVVFSDPGCPYCKRLEGHLASIDDVTVHTFVVPFQGDTLPAAILCAADRDRAWHGYMLQADESLLARSADCAHPLQRNAALARRLRIAGTPTLVFADGQRNAGVMDAAQIEARLNASDRPARPRPGGQP